MNKKSIVEKIRNDGRTIASWSRLRGHKPPTVVAVLDGRIGPTCYSYKAITAHLIADGYMDEESSDAKAS